MTQAVSAGRQHQSRAIRRDSVPDGGPDRGQPWVRAKCRLEPESLKAHLASRKLSAQLPREHGSVQVRQTLTQHDSAITRCACFNKTVLNSSCGLSGGPFFPCKPEREMGLLERDRV